MANPLMSIMGGTQAQGAGINMAAVQQLKQIMNMLKTMKNPQEALMQIAQQDPQLNAVMQMCQGRNPQEVFYEECKKSGVNPDEIINALRG